MSDDTIVSTDAGSEQSGGTRTFRLTITQVSSYLIITQKKTKSFVGSIDELEANYRKVLTHNLTMGWWGIPFGLIWTPLTISRNAKALKQLRALAAA
jgi:hypothetical protein